MRLRLCGYAVSAAVALAATAFSASPVFADDTVADAAVDTFLSEQDIADGVAYCRELPVSLFLDGKEVESEVPPVIVKERTLIPARAVFEGAGAEVTWNEDLRQVGIYMDGVSVDLTIDSLNYMISGQERMADVPPLIIADRTMIPVRIVAEALNYDVDWDDSERRVLIASSKAAEGQTEEAGNGGETQAGTDNDPGAANGADSAAPAGEIRISRGGEDSRQDTAEQPNGSETVLANGLPELSAQLRDKLIIIDAGHGGSDTGAIGNEGGNPVLLEKDVNLDVATRLYVYLNSAGARVRMTRTDDATLDLHGRPEIANQANADLFISIHNNANPKPTASGTETYYFTKDTEQGYFLKSEPLAKQVQQEVCAALGTQDRGAKSEPAYVVLNKTWMPAILVEGAFLSNDGDRENMKSDAFRDGYAFGVANGVIKAMNASVGF
ncbi:MAG: N-acetylmuramoyl-L-alanine amidase [Clostridiales Family XIII bacterium]|nr:N-acetylmuramoyl-L-alanine amidase [Clostridiales Family XIII bacterium]